MFYANDSLGNLGFKDINISKDTTVPKITINSSQNYHMGIYFLYFIPFAIIVGGIIGFGYGYIKKKQEEPDEHDLSLIKM